jgi:hypothetical protein
VRGNVATKDFLTHMYDDLKPTGLLPSAVVYLTYTEGSAGTQVIDDYETNPSPGISSSGGAVTFDVSHLTESTLNGNSNYCPDDFMNGMLMMGTGDPSQSGVAFDWAPGDQKFYQWNVVPGARDFSARGFLSLKVSQGTRHPRTVVLDGPCYFTIELRDTAGHTSAIRTEAYGGVTSPFPRTGDCTTGGSGWANEQHTIRVRLADFENDNSQLDLANIAAVTLRFGSAWGSDRGRLVLDHLDLPQE